MFEYEVCLLKSAKWTEKMRQKFDDDDLMTPWSSTIHTLIP